MLHQLLKRSTDNFQIEIFLFDETNLWNSSWSFLFVIMYGTKTYLNFYSIVCGSTHSGLRLLTKYDGAVAVCRELSLAFNFNRERKSGGVPWRHIKASCWLDPPLSWVIFVLFCWWNCIERKKLIAESVSVSPRVKNCSLINWKFTVWLPAEGY